MSTVHKPGSLATERMMKESQLGQFSGFSRFIDEQNDFIEQRRLEQLRLLNGSQDQANRSQQANIEGANDGQIEE